LIPDEFPRAEVHGSEKGEKIMKGAVSGAVLALAVLVVVLFGAVFAYSAWLSVRAPAVAVEYEGEWDKIYAPEEVGGTDLSITETSITDGATLKVTNVSYDLNGTDGTTTYVAFGVEVDGSNGIKSVDIDGELGDDASTSEVKIRNAYIVEDEEGNTLDISDATYKATVSSDGDEFKFDISVLPEGEYVVVVELKSVATSTLASGDNLLTIDFDGTTDGDVDNFTAEVYNG